MTYSNIIPDFNIADLQSHDFKEDSVREVIIMPILKKLGYENRNIFRSKILEHPFLKIGSKKRPVNLVPDYLLKVEDSFAWVLDAKAPNENIIGGDNVEQAFSYAFHPEVRAKYFALCNGNGFSLFRTQSETSVLHFNMEDIEQYWDQLISLLAPSSFSSGTTIKYNAIVNERIEEINYTNFEYLNRPILEDIVSEKQSVKRHYGVHGYFTKQAWNVVNRYIRNYSKPGDVVLDSYGGTGVTAIEAIVCKRKAIHVDLNPLSIFMIDCLSKQVDIRLLTKEFENIKISFESEYEKFKRGDENILKSNVLPLNLNLPKNSDVNYVHELFTKNQLAQLAILKNNILLINDDNIKSTMLLMFSGLLNKINLTYHASKGRSEGRGNSSVFAYYRYRIAKDPAFPDVWSSFKSRFKKILEAKKELGTLQYFERVNDLKIVKGTATDLHFIENESVDYIYTDPPYGSKIPYLDLSIMWNAWLDLSVTEEDYELEAIEGGERNKSKKEYSDLIVKSIEELYRVLKFDRWMSFVFAHKDPEFWHLIVDNAERIGFEYAGAVKQSSFQSSFKKRQNPFTVLSGQLIINFKKVKNPRAILKANLGMNISDLVIQTVEGVIAKNGGASLEEINDELILKGLELGFLDLLKNIYNDLTKLLLEEFDYDKTTDKFTLRPNRKFKSNIDLRLRIRYYLLSYLRRMELEGIEAHFDDIILHIMPLLKNGITPEKQTILGVLEDIAIRTGIDCWQLKKDNQLSIFKEIN